MEKSRTWDSRELNVFYQQNGIIPINATIVRDNLAFSWSVFDNVALRSLSGIKQVIGQYCTPIGNSTFGQVTVKDTDIIPIGDVAFPPSRCTGIKMYVTNITDGKAYRLQVVANPQAKLMCYALDKLV